MNPMYLGKVLGLDILISPSALVGSVAITLVAALVFAACAGLSTGEALFGGILAMLLYWLSDFLHHFGHAIELPGRVHIRRALGGPALSFVVLIVASLAALLIPAGTSPLLNALALFVAAINLLIFSAGGIFAAGIHRWQYARVLLRSPPSRPLSHILRHLFRFSSR
jgi:hypothetical protein